MKTAIIFATRTGHSKKLAEAVGERLGIIPRDIRKDPSLVSADLLFVVSGIYGGMATPELLGYLTRLDYSRVRRAAFITSAAGGKDLKKESQRILREKGVVILGEFVCKGSFLFVSLGHPNKKDIFAAADFAEKIQKSFIEA
jgi:Flavodoxins